MPSAIRNVEVLIGQSILSARAGTEWPHPQYGKVWITWSPEQILFHPDVVVDTHWLFDKPPRRRGISPRCTLQLNPERDRMIMGRMTGMWLKWERLRKRERSR